MRFQNGRVAARVRGESGQRCGFFCEATAESRMPSLLLGERNGKRMLPRTKRFGCFLAAFIFSAFATPSFAQVPSWTGIGPGGGIALSLAVDPATPTTLYAGTQGGGAFKSTNGGTSWNAVNSGLPLNAVVRALAVDPTIPTTLYAGTQSGGAFKSTNGGASWTAINTGLTNLLVFALAIDPITPT